MIPILVFMLSCLGISLALTYAWWTRYRVIALRQDLFSLRDELWDLMRAEGKLDHPAHRALRDHLNRLILIAPALSPTVVRAVKASGAAQAEPASAPAGEVPAAVAVIRHETSKLIRRYLHRWCVSGWVSRDVIAEPPAPTAVTVDSRDEWVWVRTLSITTRSGRKLYPTNPKASRRYAGSHT